MTTKFSQFSSGGEVRQDDIVVGLRAGVNTKFDFPGDGVKDAFGNYIVKWETVGSLGSPAINFVELKNAISGSNPKIITGTNGADVSVGLEVETFGDGNIIFNPAGTGSVSVLGTNALYIPFGTTGERPVGANGGIRFNSTTGFLEYWNGAAWTPTNSGAGTVTSVTATLPLLSSGGATPDISMQGISTLAQGDILYASAIATFARLAKDTNATRYLSNTGASNNPAWAEITLTNGVTGVLPLANGGTNSNLVANNGGIVYSTAAGFAILAGTATANQVLLSGSNAAPSWSTATYPASTTINQILYSSAANTIAGIATGNSAVLVTNAAGVPGFSSSLTDGQVIIGSTGATPVAASLTAGSGVTITPGAGSITIAATGSGGTVTSVTASVPLTSTGGNTPNIALTTPLGVIYGGTGLAATTINQILYSSANNTIAGLATANSAVLVTTSGGVPVFSSTMTDGQVIIGDTSGTPVAASLTAGANITITPGAGTITIASTASNIAWSTVTAASENLAALNGYVANRATSITFAVPASAAVGDQYVIEGLGAGLIIIQMNTGQTCHFGANATTVAGELTATNQYDAITLTCTVANTTFNARGQGNWTLT